MAPCRRGAVCLLLAVLLQLAAVVVLCIRHEAAVVPRADTINSQCRACKIYEQHVIGKKQQRRQADGRSKFLPAPANQKVSATDLGIAENVCRRDEADPYWIDSLHIARKGDRFELVVEGRCNAECETVKSACQELLMKISGGVQLKLTNSIDELMNFLCKSAACTKERPPSLKGIFNVWGQKSKQVFKHCGQLAIEVTSIVPEIVRAPWNWGKKIWAKDEE